MVQVSTAKQARLEEYKAQLWKAGLKGALTGSLIAAVSGAFIFHRYNHGVNRLFFKAPYMAWYFVSWNIVGIIFTTDGTKVAISRQAAIEDEQRRILYESQER